MLEVKRLSENATLPRRATAGAAGFDLYSATDAVVPARGRTLIPTDISVRLPPNCYARIAARSSLALHHGIDVGAGVVDADYRGSIGIVLFNHTDVPFVVSKGDRVAQMVLEHILTPEAIEVEDLGHTARGSSGYGSTGRR